MPGTVRFIRAAVVAPLMFTAVLILGTGIAQAHTHTVTTACDTTTGDTTVTIDLVDYPEGSTATFGGDPIEFGTTTHQISEPTVLDVVSPDDPTGESGFTFTETVNPVEGCEPPPPPPPAVVEIVAATPTVVDDCGPGAVLTVPDQAHVTFDQQSGPFTGTIVVTAQANDTDTTDYVLTGKTTWEFTATDVVCPPPPPAPEAVAAGSCTAEGTVFTLDAEHFRLADVNTARITIDGDPQTIFFGRELHYASGQLDPTVAHTGRVVVRVDGELFYSKTGTVTACVQVAVPVPPVPVPPAPVPPLPAPLVPPVAAPVVPAGLAYTGLTGPSPWVLVITGLVLLAGGVFLTRRAHA